MVYHNDFQGVTNLVLCYIIFFLSKWNSKSKSYWHTIKYTVTVIVTILFHTLTHAGCYNLF